MDAGLVNREDEPSPLPSDGDADEAHCPYCARPLQDSYRYCPGCGRDTRHVHRCEVCGHRQFVPEEMGAMHCVRCGAPVVEGAEG